MNTKRVGNATEAIVLAEFVKRGISVLVPFGEDEPFDLVIYYKEKFYRIQCKTSRNIGNGTIRFDTSSGKLKKSYHGLVDFFATVFDGTVYLIPMSFIGIRNTALRIEKTKNNQKKNVNSIGDFVLDKILPWRSE